MPLSNITQLEPFNVNPAAPFAFDSILTDQLLHADGQPWGASTVGLTSELFQTINGATGTVTHDASTRALFFHTSPASDFTVNFTNVPVTDSSIIMLVLMIQQSTTPYLPTVMQIAGTTQTVFWAGGTQPLGNSSKYDVISYSLLRKNDAWIVFGSPSVYG